MYIHKDIHTAMIYLLYLTRFVVIKLMDTTLEPSRVNRVKLSSDEMPQKIKSFAVILRAFVKSTIILGNSVRPVALTSALL